MYLITDSRHRRGGGGGLLRGVIVHPGLDHGHGLAVLGLVVVLARGLVHKVLALAWKRGHKASKIVLFMSWHRRHLMIKVVLNVGPRPHKCIGTVKTDN